MKNIQIYIDADACPVKEEVYKVAGRYKLKVFIVANQGMRVPLSPLVEMHVVSGGFDAADDWIVEQAKPTDIVVTADILLAERTVKKGVSTLGHKGNEFTEDNVGGAVANRELSAHLRSMGEMHGGPAPMEKKDRSAFLGKLDQIIQRLKRMHKIL